MNDRHLDQVAAIEQRCFNQPWSRRAFWAELHHPSALPLISLLLPERLVVGYLIMWKIIDEVQVQNLAVHPDYRQSGIARHMLTLGLREAVKYGAVKATLEVRPSNRAARALYASLGFVQVGVRPMYYRAEGEDALLLDCDLVRPIGPPGPLPE